MATTVGIMSAEQNSNSLSLGLFARGGSIFCNSRQVAAHFGKENKNINRDIRNLIDAGAPELNFEPNKINDLSGKSVADYNLTRDGFMLLVMGFTGSDALKMKLAYIDQFNVMERMLRERTLPKQSRNAQLRSAVALLGTSIKFNTRMGMDLQQARMKALVQVENETGVDLAKTFGWTAQIAPQQVETLTPTQIGQRLGIGPREANQLLKQAGLQVDSRDAKNRISWAPTDNGLPYARLEDLSKAHTDGTTQAWRWYPKVVDFLRPFSRPREAAS